MENTFNTNNKFYTISTETSSKSSPKLNPINNMYLISYHVSYILCCYNSKIFVLVYIFMKSHTHTHTHTVKTQSLVYGMYSLYLASSAVEYLFWEWHVKGYFLQETQLPSWSSLVEYREVTCRSAVRLTSQIMTTSCTACLTLVETF